MGNIVPRTNIFADDCNIDFIISTTDNNNAYFDFLLYRSSIATYPGFVISFGYDKNRFIVVKKINEKTGRITRVINVARHSIQREHARYSFDIHDKTLILKDKNTDQIISRYKHSDLRFMSQFQGKGSSGTKMIASASSRSSQSPKQQSFAIHSLAWIFVLIGFILVLLSYIASICILFMRKK